MDRLLLHACCGPCASYVITALRESYDVTAYFCNPNLCDKKEFDLRAENLKRLCEAYNIDYIIEEYKPKEFLEAVEGLEGEKEGGKRCERCFELRLKQTAEKAALLGFPIFATTLTVSPHKNATAVNEAGAKAEISGVKYLPSDFKKNGGFQKSIAYAKELGLYRQSFCGCEFSKN